MMLRTKLAAIALLTLASVATVAVAQGTKTTNDGVFTEAQVTSGEALFGTNCASCHGGNLRGTPGAPGLIGSRINKWVDKTLGEYFTFVKENMPAGNPGSLSDEQYVDVISYIFSKGKYPTGETPLPVDPAALAEITIAKAPSGSLH